jgi:hypothetical protein
VISPHVWWSVRSQNGRECCGAMAVSLPFSCGIITGMCLGMLDEIHHSFDNMGRPRQERFLKRSTGGDRVARRGYTMDLPQHPWRTLGNLCNDFCPKRRETQPFLNHGFSG